MQDSNLGNKRNRDNNVNIDNVENMNLFIINNSQKENSDEIENLNRTIENLKKELSLQKEEIKELKNENKELKKENIELKNEKKNNENLENFKKEIEFFSTKFDENIKSKYENCNNIFKEEYNDDKNDDNNFAKEIFVEINKIQLETNNNKNDTKNDSNKIYEKLEKIEFEFGEKISNEKLKEFIRMAVEYINCSYTINEKKAIKNFFEKIKENIYFNFAKTGIRDNVMRDVLISYFYKKKFEKFEPMDSLFLFKNVSLVPLNEIQVEDIKLNKDFLKIAVQTNIIIDNYKKVCKNYVENFNTNIYNNTVLKIILINHIDKMNIYFAELYENICGFTIYTGDVVINAKYLNGIYSDSSPIKFECLACIFLTILHELAHCLTRILKKLNQNKNQFSRSVDLNSNKNIEEIDIKSGKSYKFYVKNEVTTKFSNIMEELNKDFKKDKEDKIEKSNIEVNDNSFNESGSFFDLNMFYNKKYEEITEEEAKYFLTLENYNIKESKFKSYLKKLYKRNNSSSFTYRIKYI